ncbi:hypothetical protein FQN57_005754 [Myotisia sp. PD_48]|nr:hypothetical protein FQN57_005754 [Myotisia sp. PD_48]
MGSHLKDRPCQGHPESPENPPKGCTDDLHTSGTSLFFFVSYFKRSSDPPSIVSVLTPPPPSPPPKTPSSAPSLHHIERENYLQRSGLKTALILCCTIFTMLGLAAIVALLIVQRAAAAGTVVDLGYSKYQSVDGPEHVSRWLGMRYAAPPLGELRFAAPQDPIRVDGVQNANKFKPACLSTGNKPSHSSAEDCLFLNVFAPTDSDHDSNLPVFFYIHGGGFNANSEHGVDATGLIKASGGKIVVVTVNYRLGLYGFLAGEEIEKHASLNNGLKDQIHALKWVKKHIRNFGGNPDHVVIGGHSAGGASVSYLLTAYGGRDDKLFHGAIAGSPSHGTALTYQQSQYQYDKLVHSVGCGETPHTLACLRVRSAELLQKAPANYPLPGAGGPPLYFYSVVVDHDLVQDYLYALLAAGKFIRVPLIVGSDRNEGTVFVPRDTDSIHDTNRFLKNQFPGLTESHLKRLRNDYPKTEDKFPAGGPYGQYWRQGSNAYGEFRYTCPALFTAGNFRAATAGKNIWSYEYAVEDPESMAKGYGVTHTVEVHAIWGPGYSAGLAPPSYRTSVNAPIIPVVQGYWTSFIQTLDPNLHRAKDSPEWRTFGREGGEHLLIKTGATVSRSIPDDLISRCGHILTIRRQLMQ